MYFVHSYNVDVVFTLSYNNIFQLIFGICSTWKYVMLEIRNHNPNDHLIIVSMHVISKIVILQKVQTEYSSPY